MFAHLRSRAWIYLKLISFKNEVCWWTGGIGTDKWERSRWSNLVELCKCVRDWNGRIGKDRRARNHWDDLSKVKNVSVCVYERDKARNMKRHSEECMYGRRRKKNERIRKTKRIRINKLRKIETIISICCESYTYFIYCWLYLPCSPEFSYIWGRTMDCMPWDQLNFI